MIALFSALAGVLYILNFSIPFAFPGFLEFRFSDVPVLIGTFALGPVAGCIIVVFMVLIKLVIVSTSTYFVGDLADILVGFALNRTFKGALLGLGAGSLISTALAVLLNRILLVPAYVHLMFGGSWEPILGMILRCLVASLLTLLVYKRISRAINRLNERLVPKYELTEADVKKRRLVTVLSFLAVALVLVGLALLHYFLTA